MATIMPGGLKVSFFTNSGAKPMNWPRCSRKNYTKQTEFVALAPQFPRTHVDGDDDDGPVEMAHSLPYVFGVTHISPGYCYRCPFGLKYPECNVACARELEDVIKYNTSGKIAAFIASRSRDSAA